MAALTTFYQFAPSNQAPYSFQPTLDGSVYQCTVTWNLFGARYYLNVNDLNGNLVVCRALVASPTGVLMQDVQWANGSATAITASPHGYRVGSVVDLTLSGNVPAAYSGVFECLIASPGSFTFAVSPNPGPPTQLGIVSYDIDLVGQYFSTTTLVFRDGTQQFEVSDIVSSGGGSAVPLGNFNLFTLGQSQLGGPDVLG